MTFLRLLRHDFINFFKILGKQYLCKIMNMALLFFIINEKSQIETPRVLESTGEL